MLNKSFWNNRYLKEDTGWDVGYVSTPLKEYFDQLTNKQLKILIPGCGSAYEAEYLFNKGFQKVFLVDIAPEALVKFKKRVPDFPETQLICEDFFNHNKKYDLIIEQTFFCAIKPNLRPNYAKHTSEILENNGQVVGLLFNVPLNEDKPPFGGNKEEYAPYFSPYFNIDIMETAYNSIAPRENRELFIKLTKKNA